MGEEAHAPAAPAPGLITTVFNPVPWQVGGLKPPVVPTQSTSRQSDRPRVSSPRSKKCGGKCGRTLPLTSFDIRRRSKDGRFPLCKECRREARGPRGKEGQQARALEGELRRLAEVYRTPALADVLSRAAAEVKEIGASGTDFSLQVRAVRRAIDVHGCRRVDEIMEDAQLSRWAVDRALQRLLAEKAIETRDGFLLEEDAEEPGRPPVEYHPAHYPRGEDFSHTLRRAVDDDLL
jgi:hypothetical protein